MARLWFLPHWQPLDLNITENEHDAIVLRQRAPESAQKAAQEHINSLRRRILPWGNTCQRQASRVIADEIAFLAGTVK